MTTDWWGENDGIGTTDGGMLGGDECEKRRERWRGWGERQKCRTKTNCRVGSLICSTWCEWGRKHVITPTQRIP